MATAGRVRGKYGLAPFELGAVARRAFRGFASANEHFELALALATGIFE
jgi:hypothetical protein